MALTSIQPVLYPFYGSTLPVATARNKLIDASGERVAFIVTAPKTGSITSVDFLISALTTADDLDVRIETVTKTTATGYTPSGTLWSTTTNGTLASGSQTANTMHSVTLTSSASVTAGDIFAVVIQFTSDTTVSGSLEIGTRGNYTSIFPRVHHRTGGSWANDSNATPVLGLSYSGTYYPTFNCGSYESSTVSGISSGREQGVKFTLPFDCRLLGIIFDVRSVTSGNHFTANFYTTEAPGAGTTIKSSEEIITTNNGGHMVHLASPISLSKNTSYRITTDIVESATSFLTRAIYHATAIMDQDVGDSWIYCEDDGASGWTDTTTQIPLYTKLLIDQVNDTAGGGGGMITHPGMSGGMRG